MEHFVAAIIKSSCLLTLTLTTKIQGKLSPIESVEMFIRHISSPLVQEGVFLNNWNKIVHGFPWIYG